MSASLRTRAVARIHRADVLDDARVAKAAVEDAGCLVVIRARHRPHCRTTQVVVRRDRKLAHFGEILLLELVLELDPVLPGLFERDAKQALKLVGVVAPAFLVASVPGDHLLRRILIRKPRDEARAVEVRVRARLEIDKDTPRRESQWIVEMGVVPDHRAEHHLIVAALRAAHSAAHPGLHEHRTALRPPARGREARHREVVVDQRLGMLRSGGDFAEEDLPPAPVFLGSNVALHHVDQLVVHQRIHALAGGKRLEREGQRRNIEDQRRARRREGVSIAVVFEILQQDGRGLRRFPAENASLPRERVRKRAHRVRLEVAQGIVIKEVEILCLDP